MNKAVLEIIANEIEGQLNEPVTQYVMTYTVMKKLIEFSVNGETGRRPVDQPVLADGLSTYIMATPLPKNYEIKYLIIFYHKELPCKMVLHLVDKTTGEKRQEESDIL